MDRKEQEAILKDCVSLSSKQRRELKTFLKDCKNEDPKGGIYRINCKKCKRMFIRASANMEHDIKSYKVS